jgi:hypothetical protein
MGKMTYSWENEVVVLPELGLYFTEQMYQLDIRSRLDSNSTVLAVKRAASGGFDTRPPAPYTKMFYGFFSSLLLAQLTLAQLYGGPATPAGSQAPAPSAPPDTAGQHNVGIS